MMKGLILICAICAIALATASFDETVPEESLLQKRQFYVANLRETVTKCKFPKDTANKCYWAVGHIKKAMKEKSAKDFKDWHGFYCGTKENPGFMKECVGDGKVCDLSCHKARKSTQATQGEEGSATMQNPQKRLQ